MSSRVGPWKCFHCDEVFEDAAQAALHFGYFGKLPACCLDAAYVRELEKEVRAYREEDTKLHREMHAMAAKHQVQERRAEEQGYARGLRDAHLVES